MAVLQMTEELKTLQETCLSHQSAVRCLHILSHHVWSFCIEIVVVAHTCSILIYYILTIIYRCLICRTRDVTIVHAVHHHRLEVAAGSCYIIVTHNTTDLCTTSNICIAVAVDNTGTAIKQAYYATHIVRTANATTTVSDVSVAVFISPYSTICSKNATVVYTSVTSSFVTDGPHIIASIDGYIINK